MNCVLTGIVILIFNQLGWFSITHTLVFTEAEPFLNILAVAILIGFVYNIILYGLGLAFTLFLVATCFVGCLLLPIYYLGGASIVSLYGASQLLPGWFNTSGATQLQLWLMLVVMYRARLTAASEAKTTVITSQDRLNSKRLEN